MNRKRILTIAGVTAALLLVAGLAWAAFSSWKQTADSNFSAASVGTVDIGDAETTALFTAAGIEPGYSAEQCFTAHLRPNDALEVLKIYSGGVNGSGLEDYLLVSIDASTSSATGTAGLVSCLGVTTHPLVTGEVLSTYATTATDYSTGDSLGILTAGTDNYVTIKITMTLPNTPEVVANASGSAQTSWVVENQDTGL